MIQLQLEEKTFGSQEGGEEENGSVFSVQKTAYPPVNCGYFSEHAFSSEQIEKTV